MKHLTLATLYRAYNPDDDLLSTELSPLTIDGKPVDFLLDIIANHCEFYVVDDNVWCLKFFLDGAYKQHIYISFASCSAEHEDIINYLNTQCLSAITEYVPSARELVKAVFIHTKEYEPTEKVIHYGSYLVRGTSSLKYDILEKHSDRFLHVDGRGTVLFSQDTKHLITLQRQAVLLALAKAYLLAASDIVNELGECCEELLPLRKLYKQAVIFNAKSYFTCPVKVNRYDAYMLWQGIRQTMPIDDVNNEIVQQIQSIHRLLSEEEDMMQYETEKRISMRLGWMGVGIGLLSLVTLFEITPDKVTAFFSSWWHIFF